MSIANSRTIWITYAWADNKTKNVDFIAQELRAAGLTVKLDRSSITAGIRLWEQIERFIQDPNESDAWLFYATTASLLSAACQEEYAYALDRALHSRGQDYPIIGLVAGSIDRELLPAGIRTRLYVSLNDSDWGERVTAAVEKRPPNIAIDRIEPYYHHVHQVPGGYAIEFRPRAGTWYPFMVAVPLDEKDILWRVTHLLPGAPGTPPPLEQSGIIFIHPQGPVTAPDGSHWWTITANEEATPTKSFYLFVKDIPSRVMFGPKGGNLRMVSLSR